MKKLRVVAVYLLLFSMLINLVTPLQVIAETLGTTESNSMSSELAEKNESKTDSKKTGSDEQVTTESSQSLSKSDSQTESTATEEITAMDEQLFEATNERADVGLYTSITGSQKISTVFPDPNLAVVVANTLGYAGDASRTVTQTKLNTITTLSADSINISSIEGVQYLNGATKISFENSLNVDDLSPLAGASLSKLKKLYFKNNRITDLTPLATAGLSSLEELYVESNQLTNLSGIENIKSLKILSFQNTENTGNTIVSLGPLAQLTSLQTIFGKSNKVESLQPLANLSKLTNVFMESNNLTNIVGMENKPNLVDFSIMSQQVDDLTPIASSTELVNLYIRQNNISSVEPLKNLTKLTTLLMEHNHVIDISPLSKLTGLTSLMATNQTRTLTKAEYSVFVPFELENTVKTKDGSIINPTDISDSGNYVEPMIGWDLPAGKTEVSYTWNTKSAIPGEFGGTIIQPLDEQASVDFTISNTIVNNPDPNETVTYTIQMVTEDGKVIPPSKNGLSALSSDETIGTFSLANNESITLKGPPKTTYKVVEDVDSTIYNSMFSSVHDSVELTDQTLPSNKTVTSSLADKVNTLDFINKYKAKLIVENFFTIPKDKEHSGIYDIIFTYPDGSTSEKQYTNTTIEEGQPFEEMLEVGTTFQITISRELTRYETSVSITENGVTSPRKFDVKVVSGTIGANENKVEFSHASKEILQITTYDSSKYPNYNQDFEYTITITKPDGSVGKEYYASTSSENGEPSVSYKVALGQPCVINLKDGDRLTFATLPLDIQLSVIQKGVPNYRTYIPKNPSNGITSSGGLGGGNKYVGGISSGIVNHVIFSNFSDYTPPTTGIDTNQTPPWVIIFITIVCLAGLVIQWWIRRRMNSTNKI